MDKIDLCPDKPGPIENEGCPEIKLNLVDLAGQTLKTSTQAKDGSFTYESLPNDSICVFRLDGDPDKTIGVNEVRVIVNGASKRAIRSQADGLFRFDIPKPIGNGLKTVEVKDITVTLTKEEQAIVKKAFDNLEFESGKDIIRTTSYSALDELATLLIKHPEWALKISGHTDNVGTPPANMTLSKKRSEAVKKYLVSKGVPTGHLKTEWYGQTRPIQPNTTEAGRRASARRSTCRRKPLSQSRRRSPEGCGAGVLLLRRAACAAWCPPRRGTRTARDRALAGSPPTIAPGTRGHRRCGR